MILCSFFHVPLTVGFFFMVSTVDIFVVLPAENVAQVADHINEKKRCRDLIDQLRTRRIDVDDWGELVLRGYFRIPGKKDLRLVLLFHRAILLCKTNGASQSGQSGAFSPSGSTDQLWFASNATTHGAEFGSSNTSLPNLGGHSSGSGTVQIREIISVGGHSPKWDSIFMSIFTTSNRIMLCSRSECYCSVKNEMNQN